jgi:hypothetical protein
MKFNYEVVLIGKKKNKKKENEKYTSAAIE